MHCFLPEIDDELAEIGFSGGDRFSTSHVTSAWWAWRGALRRRGRFRI